MLTLAYLYQTQIDAYTTCCDMDPDFVMAECAVPLAAALIKSGDTADAESWLADVIDLAITVDDPEEEEKSHFRTAAILLINVLQDTGEHEAAQEVLENVQKLDFIDFKTLDEVPSARSSDFDSAGSDSAQSEDDNDKKVYLFDDEEFESFDEVVEAVVCCCSFVSSVGKVRRTSKNTCLQISQCTTLATSFAAIWTTT